MTYNIYGDILILGKGNTPHKKGVHKMFAIMYEMEDGNVFKVYNDLADAQATAKSIADNGTPVTVFDYDIDAETFLEFYTIG